MVAPFRGAIAEGFFILERWDRMKKRYFARLLAFVMSTALVLQPVAVYAADPGKGDVTDHYC